MSDWKKRMIKFAVTLAVVFAAAGAVGAMAGVAVIANPDVSADQIDKDTLQKVFLGSTDKVGGAKVTPALLKGGAAHDEFAKNYLSKSATQLVNHWRKIVFSGKGKMPEAFGSDADMVNYVKSTPGAIGYIDDGSAHDGVKVLTVN